MKRFKAVLMVLLTVSLISSAFYSVGWTQETTQEWFKAGKEEFNMADILIARPLGIVAGIVGSAIFVVSLPFTIPTHSVNDAAQMFVVEPFSFSFVREFPDENITDIPLSDTYKSPTRMNDEK